MKIVFGVILLAFLVVLFRILRGKNSASQTRPDQKRIESGKPKAQYHAVSLKFAQDACDSAKAMDGRRFLSSAAPRIPLPDCDAVECKCRFVHHKDRRSSDDRRSPFGQGIGGDETGEHKIEQRSAKDRRKDEDIF